LIRFIDLQEDLLLNFRRLEVTGFKSFADKVELAFEPGITAVVGPNGCGKSNIADAIKWALGEQNAKALRCDKMEDLIFNGGSSRRQLGMSQVSLVMLNTDGNIDTERSRWKDASSAQVKANITLIAIAVCSKTFTRYSWTPDLE
jgi:chromosome segregation ATPase